MQRILAHLSRIFNSENNGQKFRRKFKTSKIQPYQVLKQNYKINSNHIGKNIYLGLCAYGYKLSSYVRDNN